MTAALSIDWQTVTDGVALGSIYALMAVGIGLVFGVLRLVNFAYGQLIMAGAYTLAYTSGWPLAASIAATFAISFLLQSIALIFDLRNGQLGEVAASLTTLAQPITVFGAQVREITLV